VLKPGFNRIKRIFSCLENQLKEYVCPKNYREYHNHPAAECGNIKEVCEKPPAYFRALRIAEGTASVGHT